MWMADAGRGTWDVGRARTPHPIRSDHASSGSTHVPRPTSSEGPRRTIELRRTLLTSAPNALCPICRANVRALLTRRGRTAGVSRSRTRRRRRRQGRPQPGRIACASPARASSARDKPARLRTVASVLRALTSWRVRVSVNGRFDDSSTGYHVTLAGRGTRHSFTGTAKKTL